MKSGMIGALVAVANLCHKYIVMILSLTYCFLRFSSYPIYMFVCWTFITPRFVYSFRLSLQIRNG